VSLQRRWANPTMVHQFYPVGPDDPTERRTTIDIAWLTAENTDSDAAVLLEIVAGLLVGNAASPLRKALIDSGFGEDLSPVTGLDRDFRQIVFTTGLRGTEPDKALAIEKLVLATLARCVAEGFDRELVEGILHQVEFRSREIVRRNYPYGLVLMGRILHSWLYDGDPFLNLKMATFIEKLRQRWAQEPDLFQRAVRTWLLDNNHRLLSIMEPSRTLATRREDAFARQMAQLGASLTAARRAQIEAEVAHLREFQTTPDSAEALATLPLLSRTDIPTAVEKIPTEREYSGGVEILTHSIFANGIGYLDLAFDVAAIPEELQPYLPLLGKLTVQMGAAGMSYDAMAKRIALKTGGIGCQLAAGHEVGGSGCWQKMIFRLKALERNLPDALRILADLLLEGDLMDEQRMRELIAEAKNELHAAVVPSGHIFARMSAAAFLSLAARREEQWHGRTQLQFLSALAGAYTNRVQQLRAELARLKELLFANKNLIVNMTGATGTLAVLRQELPALLARLPEGTKVAAAPSGTVAGSVRIGVAIPAQVSYVAAVMPAPSYDSPLSAPLYVAAQHLSRGYLYRHIRVQGGAYGASASYDPLARTFAFLSYRDPRLVETLQVFGDAVADITMQEVAPEELDKAVMSAIGSLDRPLDPSSRGYMALLRHVARLTDERRQAFRDDILQMEPGRLRASVADFFTTATPAAAVAVYAAREKLLAANETLQPKLTIEPLVP